ncbi:hypothetical protein GCM10009429_14210 [Dyella marensis]
MPAAMVVVGQRGAAAEQQAGGEEQAAEELFAEELFAWRLHMRSSRRTAVVRKDRRKLRLNAGAYSSQDLHLAVSRVTAMTPLFYRIEMIDLK